MKYLGLILISALIILSIENIAYARDAVEMGNTAQSYLLKLGIAVAGIGITLAGIMHAVGLGKKASIVLENGMTGAGIILGISAIFEFLSRVSGVSITL